MIDDRGQQLGILSREKALSIAEEKELDLVEVSPDAKPPVCKLVDYDKLRYQKKLQREQSKKKAHKQEMKEIRLTPNTGGHDIEFKVKQGRKFLEKRDKLKIHVKFMGREKAHPEIGEDLLNRIIEDLSDVSEVDVPRKWEQNRMVCILKPHAVK